MVYKIESTRLERRKTKTRGARATMCWNITKELSSSTVFSQWQQFAHFDPSINTTLDVKEQASKLPHCNDPQPHFSKQPVTRNPMGYHPRNVKNIKHQGPNSTSTSQCSNKRSTVSSLILHMQHQSITNTLILKLAIIRILPNAAVYLKNVTNKGALFLQTPLQGKSVVGRNAW